MARSEGTRWEEEALRLAVPSDGELHEPTLRFLEACGLPVRRTSLRRYTAHLENVPGVLVLFQRAADIPAKVDEGSADLGIVGLDRFQEFHREGGEALVIVEDLGYGRCQLVVAVPQGWVDVTTTADLADLAVEFRESSRELRVATKYPRLVGRFLHSRGVHYFTLVPSSGTLEAAPAMGFADIIADIASTGTTLRENRLKTLEDGVIFTSQACLIGNRATLAASPLKRERTRILLERIEGSLRAGGFYRVTANVQGTSAEAVARHLLRRPELAGLRGPTVARVYSPEGEGWYAVTVVVPQERLLEAVDYLRQMGGTSITVFQPHYIFGERCQAYRRLEEALGPSP